MWKRIAPPLILTAPFVHFLVFYEYPLLSASGLTGFALFAGLGLLISQAWHKAGPWRTALVGGFLLALYADIQFPLLVSNIGFVVIVFIGAFFICRLLYEHIAAILTLVFATLITTTLLLPTALYQPFENGTGDNVQGQSDLPAVLHIIMDEQIGIEGLPPEFPESAVLANNMKKLYLGHGFRLYGKAHSEYFFSKNALSHMVNLAESHEDDLADTPSFTFKARVTENRYFETMAKRGYRVEAYQSDYMDFCNGAAAKPPFCLTYRPFPLAFIADEPWPAVMKIKTLLGTYLIYSDVYNSLRQTWYLLARGGGKVGLHLPQWNWEFSRAAPVGTLELIPHLAQRLSHAQAGELYFVHLLLPHSPYAFRADCSLKPADLWQERRDRVLPSAQGNTAESRALRYHAYFEQMACANRQIEKLIAAFEQADIPAGRVIIVHGDHGSRIAHQDARDTHRDELSQRDIIDSYATLFAIKGDGIGPAYDLSRVSMQDLVAYYVKSGFMDAPADHVWPAPVFHYSAIGKRVARQDDMPDFGAHTPDQFTLSPEKSDGTQ